MNAGALQATQETTGPAGIVARVERRLDSILSSESERWAEVDARLRHPVGLLAEVVGTAGKRLRPLFLLAGYRAAGGTGARRPPFGHPWAVSGEMGEERAVDAAAAVELLHAFALLHDHVTDGSGCRLGGDALHVRLAASHRSAGLAGDSRRFGEGTAVLIGDLAMTLAEQVMASVSASDATGTVRRVWDEMRLELLMGGYLGVATAASAQATAFDALLVARYKSGAYTVERPLQMGAALAGGTAGLDRLAGHFTAFGRPLGEAFQLRDDLLGVYGAESVAGKPVGEDLREGKPTLLLGLGREMAGPAARPLFAKVGAGALTEADVAELAAVLDSCGARRAVEVQIRLRHVAAMTALHRAPIPAAARAELEDLAECTLWRAA
jgi:geranylgeranyl diphosphate synthase type I